MRAGDPLDGLDAGILRQEHTAAAVHLQIDEAGTDNPATGIEFDVGLAGDGVAVPDPFDQAVAREDRAIDDRLEGRNDLTAVDKECAHYGEDRTRCADAPSNG